MTSNQIQEYIINLNHHGYLQKFVKIQKSLTNQHAEILFPLCQDCTTIYINHISNYKMLIGIAKDTINQKFHQIPKEVFQIQYNNAIQSTQLRPATMTIQKTEKSHSKVETTPVKPKNNLPFCDDPFNCTNSVHQEYPLLFDKLDKSKTYCPFLSCFVFHISYNGHYATINDNRIGFYKYNPNTISENNVALFFILQLIEQLKNAFTIKNINISYTPNPSISIGNNKLQELVITDKKKKSHSNEEFNIALNSLYEAFVLINNNSKLQGSLIPPYDIDLSKHTVGNVSYVFKWTSIEIWSLAMRYLLYNLKNLQFRSVRSSFYH